MLCNSDYVMQVNVDLVFLCETWLHPVGDEADCAALTPPGFYLKSLPRQFGTGGGLAVLLRTSLTRNIAVSTQDFVFTAFEICEARLSDDSHTAVFLSVYHPPPSWQKQVQCFETVSWSVRILFFLLETKQMEAGACFIFPHTFQLVRMKVHVLLKQFKWNILIRL